MKHFLLAAGVLAASCFLNSTAIAQDSSAFSSETIDPGLVVSDANKTVHFYTEAIGFKEIKGFSVPADWTKDVGLTDGKTLDIHVLVLGDGKTATKLKVMELPGVRIKKGDTQYVTSHIGIRYLTVQVADMNAALARLKAAGIKPETKDGVIALPEGFPKGVFLTLVRDPDGNLIELVGPKK